MNNEPLEREPIDRVRARLEALLKANAAPRYGVRSKRTGKPCQGAAMPNGRGETSEPIPHVRKPCSQALTRMNILCRNVQVNTSR
jgi:hypothetical protein